ncbi:elongation factor 1-alpha, partial [Trifolium pratense]
RTKITNDGNLPTPATSERTVSTPSPAVSNSAMLPTQTKKRKNHSESWNHFTLVCDIEKKAACHCWGKKIKYDNGTSFVRPHLNKCCDYKRQRL